MPQPSSDRKHLIKRYISHPLQALPASVLIALCRALPLTWAAATGAGLARLVGPLTGADRIARRNLKQAFPDYSEEQIDTIVKGVWDNLGRTVGESAQVDRIRTIGPDSRVEVIGEDNLLAARDSGQPFIIFSAHMANWEVASLVAAQRGCPLVNVYRKIENPYLERRLLGIRKRFCADLLPKGRQGAKAMVQALRKGKPVGLLVDQKLNEGIATPFFGRDAMTTTAPAELALKLRCRLIPTRLERLPGSRFRVTIHPPMDLPDSGDRQADVRSVTTGINAMLESWIRERPEQWFWVHRRWPKSG